MLALCAIVLKQSLKIYFMHTRTCVGAGTSRKHLRTKVTPDLHLTYSKNGGNLGLVSNDKKWKFLHKIICCGDLLESPRGGDSNLDY